MATIDHCLNIAVKAREITRAEADELRTRYAAYQRARAADSPVDADTMAKADLAADLRADASERRRRAYLAAKAKGSVDDAVTRFRTAGGRRDSGEASIALVEHYGRSADGFSSVVGRKKAILGRAHAQMEELLDEFRRTKLAGKTPNRARLDNIVRELHGETTGDVAAQALAQVWTRTAEWLRQRFNRAGGNIGKLENWGLPQMHNPLALVRASKEAWKARIRPMLAPEKMRDASGRPILEEDLDRILGDVYDTIITGGWASREPSMQRFGRGALSNRRAEHRFLIFRDADSWLAYQRDFGEGDSFAAMMGHVNLMARDIAALEVLGPNPDGMIEYLKQIILKDAHAAGGQRAIDRANRKIRTLDAMWKIERGATETPVSTRWGQMVAVARNIITSAVLGSAVLSAVPTDPVYQMMARRMAGLRAGRTLRDIARTFGPNAKAKAVRLGLILDSASHTLSTQARYVGTLSGPTWSQWLVDRVMTFQGMSPWTQAGKHAFGLEFLGQMGEEIGSVWTALDPAFRRTFQRYGLGEADWNRIRTARLDEPAGGARFVNVENIADVDERLAERVLEMVLQETEYAVPSSTLRGRAAFIGTDQPGTFWGEIRRSAAMFKSFPVTYLMLYGARIWAETARSKAAGAAYAGALLATTTLGGMLGIWLKDVAAGRDPRPINDADGSPLSFMGAAFLQGGGFGILGDFLFADLNRFGGGLANTLAGPAIDRGNSLLNLTLGNLVQLASGEETNFGREALRFFGSNVPGSTLWYLRAGYSRVIIDQLEHLVDPDATAAFKREQTRWANDYNTDFWWPPGRPTPSRAPNVAVLQ